MASNDQDLLPEQTQGFKVGEKRTMDEYHKMGVVPAILLLLSESDTSNTLMGIKGLTRSPGMGNLLAHLEPLTPIVKSRAHAQLFHGKIPKIVLFDCDELKLVVLYEPQQSSDGSPMTAVPDWETGNLVVLFDPTALETADEDLQKPDAHDESLQRYKESLGIGGDVGKDLSDPNDPRHCIILSLTMNSEGRPPVTIDLSQPGAVTTLKDHPFKIKEGAKFTMGAKFKVQHQIMAGLHYVQIVKRKGIRVSKDQEMLGSYPPNTDKNPVHEKKFAEEDAPSGMIARGHYTAVSTFVDDDKKTHLTFEWSFDIAKDW